MEIFKLETIEAFPINSVVKKRRRTNSLKSQIYYMRIIIRSSFNSFSQFSLDIETTTTISDLKQKIQAQTKIPLSVQVLTLSGVRLDDKDLFDDYEISEGTVIIVYELRGTSMPIFVRTMSRQTLSLFVSPYYTVGDIKNDVADRLGVPTGRQILIFAGRQLANNSLLASNNIAFESTIYLIELTKPQA